MEPAEAIKIIHDVAESELVYTTALNAGRGVRGHLRNLEKARVRAFEAIVGRKPDEAELERLVYGDA